MKKALFALSFMLMSYIGFSQNIPPVLGIQLTLKYNTTLAQYEVVAKPNVTLSQFPIGNSQISILLPNNAPDDALVITSVAAGTWEDNSIVASPAASPNFDFHGVGSMGAKVDFVADKELVLFTFKIKNNACLDGVRLFNNGTDPDSKAVGMKGGDFSNTIVNTQAIEIYLNNYNNTGISCPGSCNITAPLLSK